MEKDLTMFEKIDIKSMIYEIRGKEVMLDRDLAILYNCINGPKTINQAVTRNKERFPKDFCFRLTKEEYKNLKSQFETSSLEKNNSSRSQIGTLNTEKNIRGTNLKYLPNAFTEQGVAMLSSVLRTSNATEISISIMRIFVEMRGFIRNNNTILERLYEHELKLLKHDNKFDIVFNELQKEETIKQKIFYNGQIYDAHSLIVDIIKNAKKNIILIDNYIDITTLDLLSKKNNDVSIIAITDKSKSKLLDLDINKFNTQYPKLTIKYSSDYHDRFIIIDNETIYHCGASLKDLGKKAFAITNMEDKSLLDRIK